MSFAPEKYYGINQCHQYSEIYWSNLWWELQDQLPEGSTVVSIILVIDETQVNLLGQKKVHPIYLIIGNINKAQQCTYSKNGYIIIGYLPSLEYSGPEKNKSAFIDTKHLLYHIAIFFILEYLKIREKTGVMMKGPDSRNWWYFPII
ncbi:hypothetical protein BC938DRAFT_474898 [Jimgerdemannia flammicorona]|uniref:Uncharacterized protein n=1 Tax=Jimgerdemannia flammicorona TaxID=994334 RepID=A0A433Q1B8_9FUNG|nr:hypothetical protein BC938DRAFT_474898 [Jimgerdemannia flammicorona]